MVMARCLSEDRSTCCAALVAELAMRWYCALRTGVTYILAVLLSHLSTSAVSSHLLARADVAYEPVAAELGPIESGV